MQSTRALFKYGSTSQYAGSTLAYLTNAAATRAQALAALARSEASSSSQSRPAALPKPRLPRPPQTSSPAPGGGARGGFSLPCRKMTIHYCPEQVSSSGVRSFLEKDVQTWAGRYPTVEWVVAPRKARHPVLIAQYANGRSKEICVRNKLHQGVAAKLQLLLDASGRKIVPLKRRPVESTNESARGIWSPLHTAEPARPL